MYVYMRKKRDKAIKLLKGVVAKKQQRLQTDILSFLNDNKLTTK